ncbi:MAG: efflux RND transporter permease subunit [Cytophagales bacterium]|nr:efflux RND transporter permease subunit [Cytophagales bacterium]
MNLPKIAIQNHQFTVVIILLIVLVGIVTFLTMPRSEDPQNEMPGTAISIIYPGATPEDIEKLVIDPAEEVLNELDDIKKITSRAADGQAFIAVEFTSDSDPEDKYRKVIEKMNIVEKDLPEEIYSIEKIKFTVMDVSILQLALVSEDMPFYRMEKKAEILKDIIEKATGVRKVEILAVPERQVRINIDFARLAQFNISLNQVIGALQSNNDNIPGGSIEIGAKRMNIVTSGQFEELSEIKNTIINSTGDHLIRLEDVAEIKFQNEDDKYLARFNGQRAIFVNVLQKKGSNIYDIDKYLQPRITAFEKTLDDSIALHTILNQADGVRHRVGDFFANFAQGILLVGFFIVIAVGIRASIVVMLAIPVSVLIGLTLLDISGFGMQQMSIAGLIIALGLLVDNSIAVVENICRYLEMGHSKRDAAIKGTRELGRALVSSTVTTVLAFIPMIAIGGPTGDFIRSLAVIVVYTLIGSLAIALTFTPYLSSFILKHKNDRTEKNRVKNFIDTYYSNTIRRALKNPWITISITTLIFFGSLGLFGLIGVSFFPKAEKPQFVININTPEGSSLDKTDAVVRYVEKVLGNKAGVRHVAANVGHGNPQVYYNIQPKRFDQTHGQVFVTLHQYDRMESESLVRELRGEFEKFPGAKIEVKEFIQGPPVEAPIAIKVIGNNLDLLKTVSKDVESIIKSKSGVVNVENPLRVVKTDLKVKINKYKASMLGLDIRDIDLAVRTNITGMNVGAYRDNEGEDHDMVLRLPKGKNADYSDFQYVHLTSATGAQIPLDQVADVEFKPSLKEISHYNLDRQNTITADVSDLMGVTTITKSIIEDLDNYEFPSGFGYTVGGQLESQEESFGDMGKVLIISLLGIFAVLVLQFKSFTQPLIIYSAIPLAATGAFVSLFITGHSFSFMAFVGLTSLVGIVVNDSIILVDFINRLRLAGMAKFEAIIEAGKTRFMPIMLTSITTIGGLLPLTLKGGDMWAPMGWAIIGGLLFSTLLCLIIVPVLYKLYSAA